jgi:hypothetical protein
MKRSLLLSILGIALSLPAASAYATGGIYLDNYNSTLTPKVTYGFGWGGLSGTGLLSGTPSGVTWTVGFYYAVGDVRGSVAADPNGWLEPSTLGGGLTLASGGAGDTATIFSDPTFAGFFSDGTHALIGQGWTSGPITVEMVAYSGTSFADSLYRGHSDAFIMTPTLLPNPVTSFVGDFMPSFAVNVPEPTAGALTGMATLGALLFLKRKER